MRQTPNYDLNLFDATDEVEDDSRLAFNTNFGIIDTALKEASENGGIAVQDTQPTNDVLAWVDSDALGADFCFVGDTAPTNDGSVAVWVDTSEDEIPVQSGAGGVSYDNTESGLTADNVQSAIDEITADFIVEQGTSGIWTYRKWNSGIAECWAVRTYNSKLDGVSGSLYFAELHTGANFPFTFTSVPACSISAATPSGNAFSWLMAPQTTTTFPNLYVGRSSAYSNVVTWTVSMYAIGKWK